jgi:hypothetical protein
MSKAKGLIVLTTIALIGLTAYFRWSSPHFRRPFLTDELETLVEFTLVGITPTGQQRVLHTVEDLYSLERPSLRHIAMGIYCSVGRWTSPNNHIINSLLINGAVAPGHPDEGTIRLPALFGAIAFALLMIVAVIRFAGLTLIIPIVVIVALWHPHVLRYSMEARGYSWMLALQVASLLALTFLAQRPASIIRGALLTVGSVLIIINTVSLALDWIAPLYLTALLIPPEAEATPESVTARKEWRTLLRKNLLVQCLVIGAIGMIFLIDRLPHVMMSAQRYGLRFETRSQFIERLAEIDAQLFPTIAWKLVGFLGLLGLLLAGRSARRRWLRAFLVSDLIIVVCHILLTRTLPYPRVCGFVLPFVFLGIANLGRIMGEECRTPGRRLAIWAILALGCVGLASTSSNPDARFDSEGLKLARAARQVTDQPGVATMALGDPQDADTLRLYLPPAWLNNYDRLPVGKEVELKVIRDEAFSTLEPESAKATHPRSWETNGWCDSQSVLKFGTCRLLAIRGNTFRFPDVPSKPPGKGRALVFWYIDIKSVATPPYRVLDFVNESGLRYVPRYVKFQIRALVSTFLDCVVLVAESPAQYETATRLVASGVDRFGGNAVVFVPE